MLNLAALNHERYSFLSGRSIATSASVGRSEIRLRPTCRAVGWAKAEASVAAGYLVILKRTARARQSAATVAAPPKAGSQRLFAYKRTVEIDQLLGYYCFMRMPLHPAKSQITLPNVLFALSDPTRLQILKAIAKHDKMNCCDIQIDLSKSTASRHFRVLREAGIIRMEPRGIVCLNSLRRQELDDLFPGLLDSVLQAMEPVRPRSRAAAKVS